MWTCLCSSCPDPLQTCLCSSCPDALCGLQACVRMMNRAGNVILGRCHEDTQANGLRQRTQVGPHSRRERGKRLRPPVRMETPTAGRCIRAHTPGEETESLPFLCLLRPARVFPHLKGARSTGSRADPLPLVLINSPQGHTLLPTPPLSSAPSDINREKGI